MSKEGPKLYTSKPKKAHLKQFQSQQHKGKDFVSPSPSASAAATYTMGSPPPPPPPPPPKESFARRYKYIWPLLLTVNIAVGAYLFIRTKKDDKSPVPTTTATVVTAAPTAEKALIPPSTVPPVKLLKPLPENEQRELFKWMLEEKRKVKPKDALEKKRIDEEKMILKQFINSKSIPTI